MTAVFVRVLCPMLLDPSCLRAKYVSLCLRKHNATHIVLCCDDCQQIGSMWVGAVTVPVWNFGAIKSCRPQPAGSLELLEVAHQVFPKLHILRRVRPFHKVAYEWL